VKPEKRGPGLAIILGESKRDDERDGSPEESAHDGPRRDEDGLEMAAQDLLAAVEAKDTKGIVEAFKAMHDLCASEYAAEEEDEGEAAAE